MKLPGQLAIAFSNANDLRALDAGNSLEFHQESNGTLAGSFAPGDCACGLDCRTAQ